MLLEREEWGRERKGSDRGNTDSETDGMKRNAAEKSLRCPDGREEWGRERKGNNRAMETVKLME
jgi:hypothetical protein